MIFSYIEENSWICVLVRMKNDMKDIMVNFAYWQWDNAIPKEYCDLILKSMINATYEDAELGGSILHNSSVRRTDVFWEDPLSPIGCILQSFIRSANKGANWNYEYDDIQNIQMTRYRSENESFYDWHMDSFEPKDGVQRKLSAVILLNDPSEFSGGELLFKDIKHPKVLPNQGSLIVFPSFIQHKVTPVTSGTRYTAVAWAQGPAFK